MAWKREAGSARGYVNTDTGARISYRQYRVLYEASERYQPLDLPALAKRRRQQQKINDLVESRAKVIRAERIARLDTRNMGLIDQAKAEREALRVNKQELRKSEEFKADTKRLKTIFHRNRANLSPEQRALDDATLARLGRRAQWSDYEFRHGRMIRRATAHGLRAA